MGKRDLQALMDRWGGNLSRLGRDLGLAQSTTSRWRAEVPGYARFYAAAMAVMTPEQRAEALRLANGQQ
jgi:hypothetical protein